MAPLDGDRLRLTLGIRSVTVIIGGTIACTVSILTYLTKLDHKLTELVADRFGMARAAEVALREAIENPGFRKVDPRNPERVIVVPR